MNPTFSPFLRREYCSQQEDSTSSFHTLETSVKLIEDLLKKKTLCYHDVTHLNEAYQIVSHLESKSENISDQRSSALLRKLAKKVDLLKDMSQISAEEIITAYHLKHVKIPSLERVYSSFCPPTDLTLEKLQEIATHLPFCKSGDQFEIDAEALLGKNYSSDITALLKSKKDRFCEYQQRQAALKQLKEQNPSLYPSYLEEILHGGFFHLYDHLIHMKALNTKAERTAIIEKLSFASFAHIILEFRKATLSKVEKMIPPESHNIVFLLGNTGSGKSTTLCYLRGDPMIFQDGIYHSSTDKGHLIGNDTETSCTLFPNVSANDNLVIVDFPGFADTHGEVISLAIELTLRALTRKYSPKIVLLASITDTESRFEHVHLLGKRLERVLGTLDNCLLGLTKYSKDIDFMSIKNIEEKQREELFSPSKEEENLIQQIFILEPHAGVAPAIQAQVDQLKMRLLQLQNLRLSSSNHVLPDTEEKSKFYENLLQKEEAFKKHSGIKNILSLKNLTDSMQLEEILQTLNLQYKSVPNSVPNKLDAADEKLLETLFTHNLIQVITAKENQSTLSLDPSMIANSKDDLSKKIEVFGQSILETSLINTLLANSYPEIGEFLHLESMDPAIVRKYDKVVITDCISGYIEEVISGLLIAERVIKELKEKHALQQSQETDREWASLRSYILTLSKGISPNADPDKIKEAWESLQKEYDERLNKSEEELKLPRWMKIMLLAPLGIPLGIFHIFKQIKQNGVSQKFIEGKHHDLYQQIKAAGEAVINLKDIENTVKKKDQFDAILSSHTLSLTSISSLRDSLEKQITQVKLVYGKDEWEKRISFITTQLTLNFASIRQSSSLGENILYALISQEISCIHLPPYFNELHFLALIYSFLNSPVGSDFMTPSGKYQETLKRLILVEEATHYRDLNLSDPSYFFHLSSVTPQEYHLLNEQRQKLLELCNRNPISRLIFADAIYRLWKELPLPANDNKKPGFFTSTIPNDQAKILRAVRENAWILEYSKEQLRCDKDFILSALKVNGKALAFAHESLKNDKEVVLTAVQQNGEALQYASETFKNDHELALAAVKQNSWALQYVSEALKSDKKIVLAAVHENGNVLQYAHEKLQNDKELVLIAVQRHGKALQYAHEKLKNNRELVLMAVQHNGEALQYASDSLKNDKELVLAAIQQNEAALMYVSEGLKNNRDFILAAVQHNGFALQYASDALKNDRKLVLAAIQQNERALQYANEPLKNDRDLILYALKKNGRMLQYASDVLKSDRSLSLIAVQQNGNALEYVSKKLKNDRDLSLTAVQQNGEALQYANETFKNDREFILAAIQQNGEALQYANKALKNDKELVLYAAQKNEKVFQYASDVLKNDREFILSAVQQNGYALQYAGIKFKNDKEFILSAIQKNWQAMQYVSERFKNDRELALAAIQQNSWALKYVGERFKNEREFVLSAVKQDGCVLKYASEKLKNDKELVLAAIKQNGNALKYASDALKNDKEFVLSAQVNV